MRVYRGNGLSSQKFCLKFWLSFIQIPDERGTKADRDPGSESGDRMARQMEKRGAGGVPIRETTVFDCGKHISIFCVSKHIEFVYFQSRMGPRNRHYKRGEWDENEKTADLPPSESLNFLHSRPHENVCVHLTRGELIAPWRFPVM